LIETCQELRNGIVSIKPFENESDFDYLYRLAIEEKDNLLDLDEIKKLILEYGILFWNVWVKEEKIGVIFIYKVKGSYFLEGLKDKYATTKALLYSIRAGELALKYLSGLTNEVFTCTRISNKAVVRLCERLNFINKGKVNSIFGEMYLFRRLICQ